MEGGDQYPAAKSSINLKVTFASITASGMSHATSSDDKITVQLYKAGTIAAVSVQEITTAGATSHTFTLADLDSSKTGDYTAKVVYGSYGSVTSAPFKV